MGRGYQHGGGGGETVTFTLHLSSYKWLKTYLKKRPFKSKSNKSLKPLLCTVLALNEDGMLVY